MRLTATLPSSTLVASLAAGTLAFVGGAVTAQTSLAQFELPGPFGAIGSPVASSPDVDADGVNDLLVSGAVGVFTYSGADGSELSFHDITAGELPGALIGLPDVNADGQPDIGAILDGNLQVHSRADGALLWSFVGPPGSSFGAALELLGDVDGDGVSDLGASAYTASVGGLTRAGSIFVIGGADGAELLRLDGSAAFQDFGRDLAPLGDVDGNGSLELAVATGDFEIEGVPHARVIVVGAADGHLVHDIVITPPSLDSSLALASPGDVDGDGVEDLTIAYLLDDPVDFRLAAHSGADGSELWLVDPISVSRLRPIGDVSGDGVGDLLVASPGSQIFNGSAWVLDGTDGSTHMGYSGFTATDFSSLAAPGDLDGDGVPDLLSGAVLNAYNGAEPVAFVHSLADNALLDQFSNPNGQTGLGRAAVRVDDRTGDGVREWLLLSSASTVLFDGATAAPIHEHFVPIFVVPPFGLGTTSLAALGDVDSDGTPDHAVGNGLAFPFPGFASNAKILSGSDGSPLHEVFSDTGDGLGERLATAHDENGDGLPDVYVSASRRELGGVTGAGAVDLLSGADLSLLRSLPGAGQLDGEFGASLDASADFDFDGVVDPVVGSREEGLGQFDAGTLYVLSGVDGAELLSVSGGLGSGVVRGALIGDADGDGELDLLAAEREWQAPGESSDRGRVRVISGASGATLWTELGLENDARFGLAYGALGDVDGDGLDDVGAASWLDTGTQVRVLSGLDGAQLDALDLGPDNFTPALVNGGLFDEGGCSEALIGITNLNDNGGARLYASSSGGDWGFIDLGLGLPGSHPVPPRLEAHGDLTGGGLKSLTVRGALPGVLAAWFLSVGRADLPFKGGTLVPSPFVGFFVGVLSTDANGEVLVIDTPTPLGIPQGVSIWHQFACQDPGAPVGLSLSNGMEEVFKGDD